MEVQWAKYRCLSILSELLSVDQGLIKRGPDRLILIDEAVKLRYEHNEYALFSVVASRYCISNCNKFSAFPLS